MMDKQNEQWVISCDDCDEVLETEIKDREQAIQWALNNGWSKSGGHHYCEQCTQDHEDES